MKQRCAIIALLIVVLLSGGAVMAQEDDPMAIQSVPCDEYIATLDEHVNTLLSASQNFNLEDQDFLLAGQLLAVSFRRVSERTQTDGACVALREKGIEWFSVVGDLFSFGYVYRITQDDTYFDVLQNTADRQKVVADELQVLFEEAQ